MVVRRSFSGGIWVRGKKRGREEIGWWLLVRENGGGVAGEVRFSGGSGVNSEKKVRGEDAMVRRRREENEREKERLKGWLISRGMWMSGAGLVGDKEEKRINGGCLEFVRWRGVKYGGDGEIRGGFGGKFAGIHGEDEVERKRAAVRVK
ncbi:hypothetical protein HAX54_021684 [Datura stramonium]|uniref:Uncharacterized protein n=1 Tax=Datura stramonium TaxID=4076 RepID=A0ABS8S3D7_DATST|nr:hypothetical protein [Datura stramonium]